MADSELDEIRAKRMAELQQQLGVWHITFIIKDKNVHQCLIIFVSSLMEECLACNIDFL